MMLPKIEPVKKKKYRWVSNQSNKYLQSRYWHRICCCTDWTWIRKNVGHKDESFIRKLWRTLLIDWKYVFHQVFPLSTPLCCVVTPTYWVAHSPEPPAPLVSGLWAEQNQRGSTEGVWRGSEQCVRFTDPFTFLPMQLASQKRLTYHMYYTVLHKSVVTATGSGEHLRGEVASGSNSPRPVSL